MRIPLDYYRILGLPIQASAEQLQQAYRDRTMQLPRREYSEVAIASRKQLIDEAYAVLANPEQRQSYDTTFAKNYELPTEEPTESVTTDSEETPTINIDPNSPSIEINDDRFLGALLILAELGEYEQVLKLGRSYLISSNTDIENGRFGEPKIVRPDIVLTVAQASLELGREQWKQRRYENAATTLNVGQELLLREGLFPNIRGEIQADIYKLRPYRILELLALPEENIESRNQGLQLLREMLQERGGIDGNGNDQSGLNVDEFLRFIQQLRGYLSVTEQQALFEQEARRPSAVATYLAVYALLARGFTEREPGLIRRAKMLLTRLLKRQDVYLEMAVAALLLGQTEEASQALELSGEYQSLAFIREHSQGDPDLLPGLCLYSEHWLQSEVFPHFRDLVNQQVSLKEYFADEQLQSSLEALPPETEGVTDWEAIAADRLSRVASLGTTTAAGRRALAYSTNQAEASRENANVRTYTTAANLENSGTYNLQTVPTAERVVQGTTGGDPNQVVERTVIQGAGTATSQTTGESDPSLRGVSVPASNRRAQRANQWSNWQDWLSPRRRGRSDREVPFVVLAIIGLLGIGLSILLLSWIIQALTRKPEPQVQQPVEQVQPTPTPTPENSTAVLNTAGPITPDVARQAIVLWLDTKSKALSPQHEIDALGNILVDPALARWRKLAQSTQSQNKYRRYEHSVKEDSVKVVKSTDDEARVEAQVSESVTTLQGDRTIEKESYNSPNLRVRYDLVRQDGQWKIKSITIKK
ncbi:IMS domain-containing protein [Floridanema evergladense]|uniref:IMS domain-containing protein n=1 Tax=Floridaenema evergladense BLCC-F167 TaxID=3153639 RepID=A0ABV4WQL9_9CYAN